MRPAAESLRTAAPLLERSFGVLGRTVNALAFQDGPDAESYLFYLAWFAHNANSTLSSQDAHGSLFRGYALFSCGSQEADAQLDRAGRSAASARPGPARRGRR